MAKRRPSGDGLIRKRSDGRWEGRIVVGHRADGYPIYRSVFAKNTTRTDAKAQSAQGILCRHVAHRAQQDHARRVA